MPGRARREEWLARYGVHSASYVLLEGRKRYVTHRGVDGFLAYEKRWGIPIIAGDPVCAVTDAWLLLRALGRRAWPRPVFAYAVRDEMLPAFRRAGFGAVPLGAEPLFDPRSFTLAGGARATLRAAVNHATKAGVTVSEQAPGADAGTIRELEDVNREWLAGREGRELGFLLGQPVFDRETRKRCFVARSAARIEGYLVCEPIPAPGGWYLDLTRRRDDAARGTMELLTTHALQVFGAEGAPVASMGLSPLARLDLGDAAAHDGARLRALLGEAYERLTRPYDFRLLFRYKSKYAADRWEPRFLCFTRPGGEWLARAALRFALRAGKTALRS